MRKHGTLTKWNADRGFGFVELPNGGGDLFVHVSAFQSGGAEPRVGELLSFDVQDGPDGRKRAVNIMRAGERPKSSPVRRQRRSSRSRVVGIVGLMAVVAVVAFRSYDARSPSVLQPVAPLEPARLSSPPAPPVPANTFRCDGRQHCSQMHSCEEATYFLQRCPGVMMDGDRDGVPCEQQWCGH
jgi:cold shock CspA family protein